MARRFSGHFPHGDTVFLIVWKDVKAVVMKFRVVSRTTAVVTLTDARGNLRTVTGKRDLARYAGTIPEAALAEFRRICRQILEDRSGTAEAIRMTVALAKIVTNADNKPAG